MQKALKPKHNTDQYLILGWSKQYQRPVSLDEVHEINANLSSFLEIMERIDELLKQKQMREKPLHRKNSAYNKVVE